MMGSGGAMARVSFFLFFFFFVFFFISIVSAKDAIQSSKASKRIVPSSLAFSKPYNNAGEQIPPDWEDAVAHGNLLFSVSDPEESYRMASIGNGYMATVVNTPDVFVSGVFNGAASSSIRARIPSTVAISLPSATSYASGLDLLKGVFYKRSSFKNCLSCPEVLIEQRWYAHRAMPSVMVHEIEVFLNSTELRKTISLDLQNNSGDASTDIKFQFLSTPIPGTVLYNGSTVTAEESSVPTTQVAVVAAVIPPSISFDSADKYPQTFYFVTAIRTSLDSKNPVQSALSDYKQAQQNLGNLLPSHVQAWSEVWEAGIEVGGRLELAQAINSSFYYILSSIRPMDPQNANFPFNAYSLSPGSLATTGYSGHTFWDAETWMYPPLLVFHPHLAENVLGYRAERLAGAAAKAARNKYQGTMFPWESAFTGDEVCPWPPGAHKEQHITGDIGLAIQQYWRMTKDLDWLKNEGLNMISLIANFWTSRATYNASKGLYEVLGVIGPDEYAEGKNEQGVDNNAYTNYIVSLCLQFAIEAANVLGAKYPPIWKNISQSMYIPFSQSLQFHPEYDGYVLQTTVKQADTVLLGYPLLYDMPAQVRRNDLEYYLRVTDLGGPAMTWGMFSLGFLELQDETKAAQYFNQSYQLNINLPYFSWMETPFGGCSHFITGAGGFLQGVWAGYGGVRIRDSSLDFNPILPENTSYMKLRSLQYLGNRLDVFFNVTTTVFELVDNSSTASQLAVLDSFGKTAPLRKGNPIAIQRTGKVVSLVTSV